ncbi:MAG: hypothetical protein LBO04_04400 [Spirochaetaceae bacterium]|jgi:hypothetical protein|nr:hypothetical protein [Spirochaetaceae bacterium]
MMKFFSLEMAAGTPYRASLRLARGAAAQLLCILLFTRCDVWNKPLVSAIQYRIDGLKSIKTILVTRYPYPNTFTAGDDAPYRMTAREWADDYGLEISGIDGFGGTRVLSPSEYTVETTGNIAGEGSRPVRVSLAAKNEYGVVTTEFRITVNGRGYTVGRFNGAEGTAIPFPSTAPAGQKVSVYVYPKHNFVLKKNGLTYQASSAHPAAGVTISGCSFDMPACDVTLKAEFDDVNGFEAMRVSGGQNQYYTSLEDAVYAAGTTGTVYALAENIFIDREIPIKSGADITLTAYYGSPKTIRRRAASAGGAYLDKFFSVNSGASLKLDGGNSAGFVIDGGLPGGTVSVAALVAVNGGTLTVGDGVTLQNNDNSNGNGGGVCVYGGLLSMEGGLVRKNTAQVGGGIAVHAGEFLMKDGAIKENTAWMGGGVFSNSVFSIGGNALVAQDNDVYLTDGKVIAVSGSLTPPGGLSAKITPQTPSGSGSVVLYGITREDAAKFTCSAAGKMIVFDGGGQGKIADIEASRSCAAGTSYHPSLQEAVTAAAGTAGMPDTITLLKDLELTAAVSGISGANKHIRLTVPNGGSYTVRRGAGVSGSLFSVGSGASLILEGGTGGALTIDGGAKWNGAASPAKGAVNNGLTASKAMITVDGGTLSIKAGAVLQNNHNANHGLAPESPDNGGGVYVINGALLMDGGEIKANKTAPETGEGCLGGGVFLYGNSYLLMTGDSKISDNFAKWGGGAGLKGSAFVMQGNAEISGNAVSFSSGGGGGGGVNLDENALFTMKGGAIKGNSTGSGVRIHKGTFRMEGGVISGNTSDFDGGGVSVSNKGGVFTKTGGVIYGGNETAASLRNSAAAGKTGHAAYGGPLKKRDKTADANDPLDSGKQAFLGGWE